MHDAAAFEASCIVELARKLLLVLMGRDGGKSPPTTTLLLFVQWVVADATNSSMPWLN